MIIPCVLTDHPTTVCRKSANLPVVELCHVVTTMQRLQFVHIRTHWALQFYFSDISMTPRPPDINRTCWMGVKHQLTYMTSRYDQSHQHWYDNRCILHTVCICSQQVRSGTTSPPPPPPPGISWWQQWQRVLNRVYTMGLSGLLSNKKHELCKFCHSKWTWTQTRKLYKDCSLGSFKNLSK